MTLKYVPAGFTIQAIPARDLTDEEVEQWGEEYLIATGLYVYDYEHDKKPLVNIDPKHDMKADSNIDPEHDMLRKSKRKSKKASKEVSKG
jgi:hypothetical protein